MANNTFVNALLMPIRIILLPFKIVWYFIKKLALKFWENRSPINWAILILCVVAVISSILWYKHDDLKWKQPQSMFDDTKKPRVR